MMRKFSTFLRDRRGVSAIEFAILGPLTITLLIGVIELGMVFLVSGSLENAVLASSRFGITGNAPNGITREDVIRDLIDTNTFGLVHQEEVLIDTIVYDNFSDIGRPEPFADSNGDGQWSDGESFTDVNGNGQYDTDVGLAGLGGPGDIVLYRIHYRISTLTALFDPFFRTIDHSATVAVRNEPF